MHEKDPEWLEKQQHIDFFGFMYADFTYSGRWFSAAILLRQYIMALILSKSGRSFISNR
jgi:hypothetical protein